MLMKYSVAVALSLFNVQHALARFETACDETLAAAPWRRWLFCAATLEKWHARDMVSNALHCMLQSWTALET